MAMFNALILLAIYSFLPCCELLISKPHATTDVQEDAARGLIQRILPDRWTEFIVSVTNKTHEFPEAGFFSLESFSNGSLRISGSSGVMIASGFYYYLKTYCGCHVSWAGDQLNVSKPLPRIKGRITLKTSEGLGYLRYYENVCTPSYSFVWWNWTRWEREIDWMAMNGVNLPLALTGQEAIYRRTYLKLGLTVEEVDGYFSGPGFFAWQTMGNIFGLNGPLTELWMTQHVALQHKILKRMRDFGIVPVLPAFAGHVPQGLTRLYPNATITRLGGWAHFNCTYACTYFLDPNDKLFITVGKAFLTEMVAEFGTDGVFSADTFNEMTPSSSDPDYLAASGAAVYNAMRSVVPNAVWIMQAWLFENEPSFWKSPQVKALVTSVPMGKLILLDLYADEVPQYSKYNSFYGVPFIWCMLNNFGGTIGMHGALQTVNKKPLEAWRDHSSILGIGLTPEGIGSNDVMYEFMMENMWQTKPRNTSSWLLNYAMRRYGHSNDLVNKAWLLLEKTVYDETSVDDGKYYLVTRPSLHKQRWRDEHKGMDKYSYHQEMSYDPEDVYKAWDYFIQAALHDKAMSASRLFRYDLVDLTRQCLQLMGYDMYRAVVKDYSLKNWTALAYDSVTMLSLLDDLDELLGTTEDFLLGKWLESAKAWGSNERERNEYEYNARIQITLWGPQGQIVDYAAKQWSGLIRSYYKPRWRLYFSFLSRSVAEGLPFNQTEFNHVSFTHVEQPFVFDRSVYPATPIGDQVDVAARLHTKYRKGKTLKAASSTGTDNNLKYSGDF